MGLFLEDGCIQPSCTKLYRINYDNVKKVDLYSAFIVVPHTVTLKVLRYGSHSFYQQITPYLPLPHKRSPDGAFPD